MYLSLLFIYIYIYIYIYIDIERERDREREREKWLPEWKSFILFILGLQFLHFVLQVMHYKLNILLENKFSKVGSQKEEAWRSEYTR